MGLSRKSGDFTVKGKGQHIVPVETWDKFGFCDEAKEIFDRATIGEKFTDHNGLAHGPKKGYTGHVTELMADTISDYQKKIKSNGKLNIDQQKELAEMIVDKVKNTDNKYIKMFNEAIEQGGKGKLSKILSKLKNLPKPNAKKLAMIKRGYGVIKGIAKIPASGFKLIKRIPGAKYAVPFAVGMLIYNNARADGLNREQAGALALTEALNPYPVGPDDIREGANYLWNTAESAALPVGDKFVGRIMNNIKAINNPDVQADKRSTGSAYDALANSANSNPEHMYIPEYK